MVLRKRSTDMGLLLAKGYTWPYLRTSYKPNIMRNKFTLHHKMLLRLSGCLGLLMAFVACSSDPTLPIEREESKPSSVQVRLSVGDGRKVGSAITSLVACGSDREGTFTNQTDAGLLYGGVGFYEIAAFEGRKSFLFAANLTPADQSRVKTSTSEAFNALILSTSDYIPAPTTTIPMPMVAVLYNLQTLLGSSTGFSHSYNTDLTRVFALVDYTIELPSGFQLVEATVENIPAKFGLVSAIDDYDASSLGYIRYNLGTQSQGLFFLPENKVSDPVFYDADDNGMTYLQVRYKESSAASSPVHSARFRIAEFQRRAGYDHWGQVKRNSIYTFTVKITATTKNNTIPFLN